jgi:hypothetical protein
VDTKRQYITKLLSDISNTDYYSSKSPSELLDSTVVCSVLRNYEVKLSSMEKYAKKQKAYLGLPGTSKSKLDTEIARVALKVLSKNQEIKSFDFGFASSSTSTGTVSKITSIPQDDSDSGRDGDALKVVRIQFHAGFAFADATNVCRMTVVRWNQDDSSSAPTGITDLLQTASPYSPYNRDNYRAKKFTVWFDHLFAVGATGPNISICSKDRQAPSNISFQATSTAGTGHFYVFHISDSTAVTHPVLSYVTRVWFTDS